MEVAAASVAILDRVTLPRDEAGPWIERLHREYRPSAEARGYTYVEFYINELADSLVP